MREEQGTALDIWLVHITMLGIVAAIGNEIVTGKGVLEVHKISFLIPSCCLS
jgi:hypothetical protein